MNMAIKRTLAFIVVLTMVASLAPASALRSDAPIIDTGPVDMEVRPVVLPTDTRAGVYPVRINTTTVDDGTSQNGGRNIVRDDNGRIHTVYESEGEIWYSTSTDNGKTWSTAINVSNDTGAWDSVTPAIACNGSTVHVVWSDNTDVGAANEYIHYRKTTDNGASWTPARTGNAQVIYQWTPRPYTPSIAARYHGNDVYVTWMSNENNGEWNPEDVIYLRKSTDSGDSFGMTMTMSDTNADAADPTVEVDGLTVAMIWSGRTGGGGGGGDFEIWWRISTDGTATWLRGADRFTYNNADDRFPTIALDDNNITVAWQEWDGNDWDIAYKNSSNLGGRWWPAQNDDPEYIDDGDHDAITPSLATDGDGTYLMWVSEENNGNGDLMMTMRNTTVNWSAAEQMTNDPAGAMWPSLVHKPSLGKLEWVWENGTASPYNVLYEYQTVIGKPVLDWTGEVGYVTDGVEPDSGTTGHIYEFRVDYTDADDDAPLTGYPIILIDKNMNGQYDGDESFVMDEDNTADTTYTDGKIYSYSTTFDTLGLSNYLVIALDTTLARASGNATARTNGPDILSVNFPPRLDWLETEGYETDGLDPDAGGPMDDYMFKIRYSDQQNESPAAGFPKVFFDLDGDDDFYGAADENFTMMELVPGDTTYVNGKIYYYNRTFLVPGPGVDYHYMFTAEDPVGLRDETPPRTGPDVAPIGEPPVLSVLGAGGYTTDGVDPDSGTDTTEFVFKVTYTDADGDMPATDFPTVSIDIDLDGNYSAGEVFVMEEEDELDTNVLDGKVYTYGYTFGVLGNYKYMFRAYDMTNNIAAPLEFTGPDVNLINVAPQLTWVGSVGYDNDGLEPETGFAGKTSFRFQVLYSDSDDDAPLTNTPRVWIDLNLDGFKNTTEWFTMTDSDPSYVDYINGKRFEYSTTLDLPGTYHYSFSAKDENGALATGTPLTDQTGPEVTPPPNMPPILELLGVGDYNDTGVYPVTGDLETNFTYKVKYVDEEGDLPGTDWPRMYIDAEGDGDYFGDYDIVAVMVEEDPLDTDATDGKVYTYSTLLGMEGSDYTYMFRARDVLDNWANGTGSIMETTFDGPVVYINKDPLLIFLGTAGFEFDGVNPNQALEGTTFAYKVLYRDTEGEAPQGTVYLRIDLNGNGIIEDTEPKVDMTATGTLNYTVGVEYGGQYTFNDPGTYGYRFEATDLFGNIARGPAGVDYLTGPIVDEIIPNRPPILTFTGEANFVGDGIHPLRAAEQSRFTFRVKYIDLDNDAPKVGFPTVTVVGETFSLLPVDILDMDYTDGKIYYTELQINKKGDYTYTFNVENTQNQTATLGPLDGPFVYSEKDTEPEEKQEQVLSDIYWILILIIAAIVCLIIGYLAGGKRKKPEEPQYRPRYYEEEPAAAAPVSLTEEEPMAEEPHPEPEPEEAPTPEPEPEAAAAAGAGADLGADTEQPADAGEEEAKPPEEAPAEAPPEETKSELKDSTGETEAPAEDSEPGAEEKQEKVDDEIDSILSKLDKE